MRFLLSFALSCGLALILAPAQSAEAKERKPPVVGIDMIFYERFKAVVEALQGKRYPELIAATTAALAMKPDPKNAALLLETRARAYRQTHQYGAAAEDFADWQRIDPRNPLAYNEAAWQAATCPDGGVRNGRAAVRDATRACELTHWQNASYIDTLAAAYAESGNFARAVELQQRAVSVGARTGDDRKVFKEDLHLFEKHQPIRDAGKTQ
ncbi:MAG: hypothetical protein M3176_19430 [Chloroflexota bacterium]|nr:hypothetical protein [Verrucomicrobiota bacterium]MDQ6908997.1 hypothetical protein [Chloroflexota bacterium]